MAFKEENSDWRLWCRLCANDDEQNTSLIQETELLAAVETHFGVQMTQADPRSLNVCQECISVIRSFIQFKARIQRVQEMYAYLQANSDTRPPTFYELRVKYDLLDEGRKQKDAEVHYLEAKPNVQKFEAELFVASGELHPIAENNGNTEASHDGGAADEFDAQDETEVESEAYLHNALIIADGCDPFDVHDEAVREESPSKIENRYENEDALVEEEVLRQDPLEDATTKTKSKNADSTPLYYCHECPRQFKLVQHYRQHMKRTHSQSAPANLVAQCLQCSRSFATKYQLRKHAKVHLPLELKKVVPCPFCEKKFTSNNLVRSHIKHIHMNERPFICEECGVAVRTNAALKTHMLTHTDYAPFVCGVCKKAFKNQIRLKNHMETHDPSKHICAECGLQLNSRATLNRHLLVHSDKMTHKCDYCGRAFKRAKALKNHLILHTGFKPYSCDFCERTFANGSNCRSHKKKAHPDELAALEAAGGGRQYTRHIPKLATLKAITKGANNLTPVVSKKSGRFACKTSPVVECNGNAPKIESTAGEANSSAITSIYNRTFI